KSRLASPTRTIPTSATSRPNGYCAECSQPGCRALSLIQEQRWRKRLSAEGLCFDLRQCQVSMAFAPAADIARTQISNFSVAACMLSYSIDFFAVAGAPEGIRTPGPQIRSLVLYPTELPAPWKIRVTLPNRLSQHLPSTTIFSLGFNLADVETISHNLNCGCATCPQNRRLLVMARAGENNTGSR